MIKRIYEIIEKADDGDTISKIYDIFMIVVIIGSIVPLCFIKQYEVLKIIDKITVSVFILDYVLRWICAGCETEKKGIVPYIVHPFRFFAIIDLLSILPSLTALNSAFRILRVLRLFKTFKVFKLFRYSKNVQIIFNVLKKQKSQLITVLVLALAYIFISALIVFQVEPSTFGSFFKAIYWATVSLTTVGYGDIYPMSTIGQLVSMLSSFLGIAVVALPAGVIIAGYQKELDVEGYE